MARCMQCGKELTHNEIGAHRKFINRGAEQFFCKQCLAEHLGVTPELIYELFEQFWRQGCTLVVEGRCVYRPESDFHASGIRLCVIFMFYEVFHPASAPRRQSRECY